ncbi:TPA: hypothetical protein DDW69_01135 [candidate division CPR2 bacterium]|uniref:Transcriptional regulator, XRE family n=1 Tax=candidate division CPR2 bacterium GW2011_GWC1_41_48 TaxID=1618344 RepID=A0A0G0Z9D4_UNCC2|nr:MAG: hypothetical protein UT47_C0001G0033 [candidate division CPR2 bacterium GW2011_GWC2_39_35]KKR29473.1 MAG: hypothetical protein UT60_C0001G0009 [candidate division CPR2 bacterium GW2011_GWD2_39_7]KKR29698.1 MAG: hypothetical protein UT59_C0001G0007 [candidate division CPR2 bacterium GW2011_GWD1_39_7]KKS09628.1 MAG: Transcriptional regulator, XRE family [candidate division CPR2 bacterium GW2011_GWC1_41_48]OGB59483.1 MAG: hypothetical protein A2Y27_00825 [candidate division CPR2 bacterium 
MTPTLRNILIPILIIIAFVGIALGVANYRKQVEQTKSTEDQAQVAPELTITSPEDQEKISGSDVTVKGETDPQNKVSVNNNEIAVGQDGFFETVVPLMDKENRITVESTDKNGNKTSIERVVIKEVAVAADRPAELSQAGPETWIALFMTLTLVAYLLKRFSGQSVDSSLKKF